MTPPIRSNTLDAMQDAQTAQARVRAALESELVYLYEQIDRLRSEVASASTARDGWKARALDAERALGGSRG